MGNPPAHKFRIGLLTATIWKNERSFTVDLSRSYKTEDGTWQNTNSLHYSDLLNAAKCLERAETWIGRQLNDANSRR